MRAQLVDHRSGGSWSGLVWSERPVPRNVTATSRAIGVLASCAARPNRASASIAFSRSLVVAVLRTLLIYAWVDLNIIAVLSPGGIDRCDSYPPKRCAEVNVGMVCDSTSRAILVTIIRRPLTPTGRRDGCWLFDLLANNEVGLVLV